MKKIILLCLLFHWPGIRAQETALTLEQCYDLARQHYPMTRQRELLERSNSLSLSNVSKAFLPQLNIGGQATYQSDVITIPVTIPGLNFTPPAKDQYKLYGEINQPLTDLISTKHQKTLVQANTLVQEQNLEAELYKLKERINQIFFGILLIDEQLAQSALLKKDLENNLAKLNSSFGNGTATKQNVDVLKAEVLRTDQRLVELKAGRQGYVEMLGLFINRNLDEKTKLTVPADKSASTQINRPELIAFDNQVKTLEVQNSLLTARNLPKLGLFFQSGYARPAFNPFSNAFDYYYIGGLRLNWALGGMYTLKKDRALISVNREMLELQRETFVFNTNYTLKQQSSEMRKYRELLQTDQEIISLRESVAGAANVQLQNGTITSADYLRELNALDQARQSLSTHRIQLLMNQYVYETTSGNQ